MKLLETRQLTNKVTLMTWSPKMDILAIANAKPEVVLHRLTWQKVWVLGNNFGVTGPHAEGRPPLIPKSLTFHPEGLYLAIGFANEVKLVEVETGTIVSTHQVSSIGRFTAVKWKSTNYAHSLKDVFSTNSERLESNLSILLLGTDTGQVQIYAGAGRLLTVVLKLTNPYPCHVLDMEIPPDFSSVQVLTTNQCDSATGNVLSLYEFDCQEYTFHGDILGVFAAKAIAYRRYLDAIEQEKLAIHEHWGAILDVYKHYMSYGTGNTRNEEIRADYAELLLTGVCSAEVEMFLGSGGREKEAKKHMNTLQSSSCSLNEALKNIKCNIMSLIRELSDIAGYQSYRQITQGTSTAALSSEDEVISIESRTIDHFRQHLSLLYHGVVHGQRIADNFLICMSNFMTFLVNTIHSFSILEVPEQPEEEPDIDRVFELLRFKKPYHLFQLVEINPEDAAPKGLTPNSVLTSKTDSSFSLIPPAIKQAIPRMTPTELAKFYDEPNIIDIEEVSERDEHNSQPQAFPAFAAFLKEKGLKVSPALFDRPNFELQRKLMSFTPHANSYMMGLCHMSLLESEVPKKNYILNYFEHGELEKDSYGIIRDDSISTTYVSHNETNQRSPDVSRRVWLYKIVKESTPVVSTLLINCSEPVLSADFFNPTIFTLLCYSPHLPPSTRRWHPSYPDEDEVYEPQEIPGNSVMCHLDLAQMFQDKPSRPLRLPKGSASIPNKWTDVDITIPTDVTVAGPIQHDHIVQILPINNYHPYLMALSGPRRVGSLLDTSKRVIQLLDMDLESTENSIDLDTTINSESTIEDL